MRKTQFVVPPGKQEIIITRAFKKHIGFFGDSTVSPAFRKEAARYAGPKGHLKFPIGKPLPVKLIRHLIKNRVAANIEKAAVKSSKKK